MLVANEELWSKTQEQEKRSGERNVESGFEIQLEEYGDRTR